MNVILEINISKWSPHISLYTTERSKNEFISVISNQNMLRNISDVFGIKIEDVETKHLDIKNQFTGQILNPRTNLFINETLVLNVYKQDNTKIGNILNIYAFHNIDLAHIWVLIERQFVSEGQKVVRCKGVVVGNNVKSILAIANNRGSGQ